MLTPFRLGLRRPGRHRPAVGELDPPRRPDRPLSVAARLAMLAAVMAAASASNLVTNRDLSRCSRAALLAGGGAGSVLALRLLYDVAAAVLTGQSRCRCGRPRRGSRSGFRRYWRAGWSWCGRRRLDRDDRQADAAPDLLRGHAAVCWP